MAEVTLFYDQIGNTLAVWFDDPTTEELAEETGDEIVLMKNAEGRVIGFEKLNFSIDKADNIRVIYESSKPQAIAS